MKYKNLKEKYNTWNLQLFADEGGEDDADEDGGEDEPEEDEGEDPEEKRFSQKEVDETVKKRLARERRKWQREREKRTQNENSESADEKTQEAESKASKLEVKVACFEADVAKDSVDDVAALAHAYMEADDSLDLEDAIEKVVKKYPHFKKGGSSEESEDETRGKSWGERQRGKRTTVSGVEAAFLKKNPGLKI